MIAKETLDRLLDAAWACFRRHGYAKTSMADIAREADLSRTALYNHFQKKSEVFQALSQRINDGALADVIAAAGKQTPWTERLSQVIHARVGWVYDLLHGSEFGRELIDEKSRICSGSVLAANDKFEALLTSILSESALESAQSAAHARVLIRSLNGILETAETEGDARKDVDLLVGLLAKGLS